MKTDAQLRYRIRKILENYASPNWKHRHGDAVDGLIALDELEQRLAADICPICKSNCHADCGT